MKTAKPASDPGVSQDDRGHVRLPADTDARAHSPGLSVAELILASGSAGRASVLASAGLRFRQQPAPIDERAIEAAMREGHGTPKAEELALRLAAEKAAAVSRLYPDAIVIGADQVMECEGQLFQKPPTLWAARAQLIQLRGRTHSLHSGLAVARDGEVRWQHLASAHLTMRAFSDPFLDAYIAAEQEALLGSVGAYRIEGMGIQLFSDVQGDHFTIIGLPLLPLLAYLREMGWLQA
jgi:septum formation protein